MNVSSRHKIDNMHDEYAYRYAYLKLARSNPKSSLSP